MKFIFLYLAFFAATAVAQTCGPAGNMTIAGSSTVYSLSVGWATNYSRICPGVNVNVYGGGSSVGARQVCGTSSDDAAETPVDIGNMSRDWRSSEATTTNGWKFDCVNSDRNVIRVEVAIDGLSVVTAKTGLAHDCIEALGGLSIQQLRWIYSNLDDDQLWADPDFDFDSTVPHSDNNTQTHLWSELSTNPSCRAVEIMISGADDLSATYEYFADEIFTADGETFDRNRPNGYKNSARDEDIVLYLETNEEAIGYFGYAVARNIEYLNPVPIRNPITGEFIKPEPATIEAGDYAPLSRRLYMNLLDDATSLALTRPFINFGLSQAGQQLVELTGYSAIPGWETLVMHTRMQTSSGVPTDTIPPNDGGCGPAGANITIAGSSSVFPITC